TTGRLARIQVPSRWWVRQELLPTSPQGKVMKAEVTRQWVTAGDVDIEGDTPPATQQTAT
ncbi:MAG: hypothetical protein JWP34_4911, partial [Massilia sp.]|nr:hypothetical protein [Massilia sp.]